MRTTIYLIEDDPTIYDFVVRTLQARPQWELLGHSTTCAHARQHAALSAARVYLVDLGLPDGRGEDLLKELACSNPAAELLVFTVFGDESRLIGALEAGATGYVLKGCASDELIEAIEQIQDGGAPISPLLARMLLKRFKPAEAVPTEAAAGLVLTDREIDVLKQLAQGYVNKEIARHLDISPNTVAWYIKTLYRKMAVNSRVQVVQMGQARGFL